MTRKLIKKPQALYDVIELADYIARDSLSNSIRFIEAFENTCENLITVPGLGSPLETPSQKHENLRYWPVQDFPNHLIFFRLIRERTEILRVCHASRDLDNIFTP